MFPVVGAIVGALVWASISLTGRFWSPSVAVVFGLSAGLLITGALHEDGWADTWDGLFGAWSPQKRLAILRDSRIGTYGACGLVLALLLKFVILVSASERIILPICIGGAITGRLSAVYLLAWGRPARDPDTDVRRGFTEQLMAATHPGHAVLASLCALLLVLLATLHLAWGTVCLFVAAISAICISRIGNAKIGGITGDLIGASVVLGELGWQLTLLAAFPK